MTDTPVSRPNTTLRPRPLWQLALGLAYVFEPRRLPDIVPLCGAVARDILRGAKAKGLPDVSDALERPDGYCGIAHDLSPEVLNEGYARGLFPRRYIGPIKWWSPRVRPVLFFDQFRMGKNVRRMLREKQFTVTFDTAFTDVMQACAAPGPGSRGPTWINDTMISAYARAYRLGAAHSVEVWDENGNLAGGVYGLSVGRVFFTESRFDRRSDASRVAFAVLNRHLQHWGYALNDGKDQTDRLQRLGFASIPRDDFTLLLDVHARATNPKPGRWQVDSKLDTAGWEPKECDGLKTRDVFADRFGHQSVNWLPDTAKKDVA